MKKTDMYGAENGYYLSPLNFLAEPFSKRRKSKVKSQIFNYEFCQFIKKVIIGMLVGFAVIFGALIAYIIWIQLYIIFLSIL